MPVVFPRCRLLRSCLTAGTVAIGVVLAPGLAAQSFPTNDPVLRRLWTLGMDSSQLYPLGQALLDSIGPRTTGTPAYAAAVEWLMQRYAGWGIPVRTEVVGTFPRWKRGPAHVDLIAPRVRTLEAMLRTWSPGTGGAAVEGAVVIPPAVTDTGAGTRAAWLRGIKGKYVLGQGTPPPTCRPSADWDRWARRGVRPTTPYPKRLAVEPAALHAAGAAGVLLHNWVGEWGLFRFVEKPPAPPLPTVYLSCEDYGLVARLALHEQGARLRVRAWADSQPESPVAHVRAELPGVERPREYVLLHGHLDSEDAASGALDNGTGTLVMLEALRLLKAAYPRPKRTIVAWHWGGDEHDWPGLGAEKAGSFGFRERHPEIAEGLQATLAQDKGTGRIVSLPKDPRLAPWVAQLPTELTDELKLDLTNLEGRGPGIYLKQMPLDWSYATTYHSNRDTFDKIAFDDLRRNATLTAMLAYLASENGATAAAPPRTP